MAADDTELRAIVECDGAGQRRPEVSQQKPPHVYGSSFRVAFPAEPAYISSSEWIPCVLPRYWKKMRPDRGRGRSPSGSAAFCTFCAMARRTSMGIFTG